MNKQTIQGLSLIATSLLLFFIIFSFQRKEYVHVEDGKFVHDGNVVNCIGTNFWYGPILGSEGRGGNRDRLKKELDLLKDLGVNNLRILVGSDGPEGVAYKVFSARYFRALQRL